MGGRGVVAIMACACARMRVCACARVRVCACPCARVRVCACAHARACAVACRVRVIIFCLAPPTGTLKSRKTTSGNTRASACVFAVVGATVGVRVRVFLAVLTGEGGGVRHFFAVGEGCSGESVFLFAVMAENMLFLFAVVSGGMLFFAVVAKQRVH